MIKPLKFVGSSKKDLSSFPDDVKQDVGHALFTAQEGGWAATVKTLQGFGGGSETPKHEIDLIHARLRAALAKEWN
jgi:phage-related protein